MPAEQTERFGNPRVLIAALAWRARREGLRYLLVSFIPFLIMLAATIVPSLISQGSINGGATFAAFATLYWAGMTAIAAVTVAVVVWASAATLSLTVSYLLRVLILPLLAVWAATGLSLLVALLYPRLAQAGSFGLNLGGGGLASVPAVLPAFGVL